MEPGSRSREDFYTSGLHPGKMPRRYIVTINFGLQLSRKYLRLHCEAGSIPWLGKTPGEGNGIPALFFAWVEPEFGTWGPRESDKTCLLKLLITTLLFFTWNSVTDLTPSLSSWYYSSSLRDVNYIHSCHEQFAFLSSTVRHSLASTWNRLSRSAKFM